jgi:hypothetical protein
MLRWKGLNRYIGIAYQRIFRRIGTIAWLTFTSLLLIAPACQMPPSPAQLKIGTLLPITGDLFQYWYVHAKRCI